MGWERNGFEKIDVNKAGNVLKNLNVSEDEINKATEILNNWRAIHSYPLHIFQMTLKNASKKFDKTSLTVQRLKRTNSIINKLNRGYDGRSPSMNLSQMQDIAGCRAIVSNVEIARELYQNYYLKGNLRHKRVGKKDYVSEPKKDGYRSLHVIYEFKSDKGKEEYNGLRVEVQIRSKLQHLWSTAVETVDFFTRQAIKFNEGGPNWTEFFRLISSAFAIIEKSPLISNTPLDKKKLYHEIKDREKELSVIKRMSGWTSAMKFFNEEVKKKMKGKSKFFLLELDILGEKLSVKSYAKQQEEEAIKDYSELEKRHKGRTDYDVVLVGAETTKDLQKAYPNYFVDTREFISELKKVLRKAT
ncbi:MAG: RelA/SpoT domain-containing protein [Nanoarchaeota archaeon]|nr:RelA/SpoT domain-containing protein [Nanoarchaeota archaeon]